jgi:hypothetical protein
LFFTYLFSARFLSTFLFVVKLLITPPLTVYVVLIYSVSPLKFAVVIVLVYVLKLIMYIYLYIVVVVVVVVVVVAVVVVP